MRGLGRNIQSLRRPCDGSSRMGPCRILLSGRICAGSLVEDAFKGDLGIEEKGDHILLRDGHGNARILLVP